MLTPGFLKRTSDLILIYNTNIGRIELSRGTNTFSVFDGKEQTEILEIFYKWLDTDHKQKFHNNWAICTGLEHDKEYSFKIPAVPELGPGVSLWFRAIRGKGESVVLQIALDPDPEEVKSKKNLEDFFNLASHDLQSPLRKLSTFSDMLMQKFPQEMTPEIKGYLERIKTNVEQMRQLVDDITDLSTVSSPDEEFESCDLNNISTLIYDSVSKKLGTDATFSKEALPVIRGVRNEIKRVFTELIKNAILYNRKDLPSVISMGTRKLTDRERYLYSKSDIGCICIEICNNGMSIEGFEDEIFLPFKRLNGKEYAGTGLGLAICKKIVENHDGIIFASTIAKGNCFTIILPTEQPACRTVKQ